MLHLLYHPAANLSRPVAARLPQIWKEQADSACSPIFNTIFKNRAPLRPPRPIVPVPRPIRHVFSSPPALLCCLSRYACRYASKHKIYPPDGEPCTVPSHIREQFPQVERKSNRGDSKYIRFYHPSVRARAGEAHTELRLSRAKLQRPTSNSPKSSDIDFFRMR